MENLSKMKDFDSSLKLNSLVLRHMTTSLGKKPEVHVEKKRIDEKPNEEMKADSSSANNNVDNEKNIENSLDTDKTKMEEEK